MVAQRNAAVSSGLPFGAGVSNVCCTQALAALHGAAQPVHQACQAFRDNNSGFGLFTSGSQNSF